MRLCQTFRFSARRRRLRAARYVREYWAEDSEGCAFTLAGTIRPDRECRFERLREYRRVRVPFALALFAAKLTVEKSGEGFSTQDDLLKRGNNEGEEDRTKRG